MDEKECKVESAASMPAPQSYHGKTPRLMIKKMVLENFKSYAGVKEIGPFHKCFSSIVGPNGSGKSNVIDALLFVFGKRASQIRLKKLSELIHKSSDHTDLSSCRVTVHFHDIIDTDDNDGYEVVPGSDFAISRTATRSNASTYYIDQRASSYTEVTSLLKSKAVDLDNNRFLILQGEVEQIAMMKPKAAGPNEDGLLEYLEDLIGSNQYVARIEEAFTKTEELNQSRQQQLNRVKIVEKEKDNLEGPRAEAEEYVRKERQLYVLKSLLYQLYLHRCKKNLASIEDNKKQLQEKLEHENKKLSEKTEGLQKMETEYQETKQNHNVIVREMEKAKADFESFERKDIKYREDLKHLRAQEKKLEKAVKTHAKKVDDLQKEVAEARKSVPVLEAEIESLTQKKTKAEETLDAMFESLKSVTEPIRLKMEAKQKEMIPLRKLENAAQQKIDVTQSELDVLIQKSTAAKTKYQQCEDTIAQAQATVDEQTKELANAQRGLAAQRKELTKAQAELKDVNQEEAKATVRKQELRNMTEEVKIAREAASSRGAVLDALLKAEKKGLIRGIIGRLGDLGAIDSKFDVAITTACPALNHLVVDTALTAQKCIQYLRKNNIGQVTCILLYQMKKFADKKQNSLKTPEDAPRLYDLVQVKNTDYLPAFYFALQDTLVADTLDQAVRLAYNNGKPWKVVTLQGQIIDTSGAMSGGGNKVQRGGMSSAMRKSDAEVEMSPEELKKLEAELSTQERACVELKTRRAQLEDLIAKLEKGVAECELRIRKMEVEIATATARVKEQKSRIKDLLAATHSDQATQAAEEKLRTQLTAHQAQLAEAKQNAAALEAEIEKLSQAILDAGGAKLRTQKTKVEQLNEELDAANKALTKSSVVAETSEKKITAAEKSGKQAQKELEATRARAETLAEEFKKLEDDALQVMEAFKAAEEKLNSKAGVLDKMQQEYEAVKELVTKIQTVQLEIQSELETSVKQAKDNKAKADHWQNKLAAVRRKIAECPKLQDDDVEEKVVPAPAAVEDGKMDDEKVAESEVKADVPEEDAGLRDLSAEELEQVDEKKEEYALTMLEEQLERMKPNVNMAAIQEYRKKASEYAAKVAQLDKVTEERDASRKVYEDLRKRRLDDFMAGFSVITMKLKEMYQMLTLGGDAELELVDSLDPFSEGIIFSVRPPKKSWKNIQNLSGGEKTLSSLALVFALHHYKPTPLYVMDEIDAALDFKNVSIVANYIKERTKNAQFVIISLRNNMFELADRLVGIYKTQDVTKSITIDPRKFVVPSPASEAGAAADPAH